MRTFAILLAALGLSGCIAVPVAEAPGIGVYVGVPVPALVVRPYYGYGGYGGYRNYGGDRQRWH